MLSCLKQSSASSPAAAMAAQVRASRLGELLAREVQRHRPFPCLMFQLS